MHRLVLADAQQQVLPPRPRSFENADIALEGALVGPVRFDSEMHGQSRSSKGPPLFSTVVRVESGGRGEGRADVRQDGDRLLVVLADGAGGVGGGATAAQTVCAVVLAESFHKRSWTDVLRDIDLRLHRSGTSGLSTSVVVEVVGGMLGGASVGDSGAWLIGSAGILDLTESQQTKPLLGSGAAEPRAIISHPFDGRLLVASDGLFKYARRSEIQRLTMTRSLEDCVSSLLDCIRLRSGRFQDDVSIVLACRPSATP